MFLVPQERTFAGQTELPRETVPRRFDVIAVGEHPETSHPTVWRDKRKYDDRRTLDATPDDIDARQLLRFGQLRRGGIARFILKLIRLHTVGNRRSCYHRGFDGGVAELVS